jgi:hypothetical protein
MPTNPFASVPRTASEHFKLYFYAAVLHLVMKVSQSLGSFEGAFEHFPFLVGYNNELAEYGLAGLSPDEAVSAWRESLLVWEAETPGHLPLRALCESGALDHETLTVLLTIGLIEEDARFGFLFESIQGTAGQRRPTMGLLTSWWNELSGCGGARVHIRRLQELGMIQVVNPEAPRMEAAVQIPGRLWDALRGEKTEEPAAGIRYREAQHLIELRELVLPDELRQQLGILPALLA